MADNRHDQDERLEDTLARIASTARTIAAGRDALDPDALSQELVEETARVHDELFELMRDLAAPEPQAASPAPVAAAPSPATMNDVTAEVTSEVLSSLDFPLRVSATYGDDRMLPGTSLDPLRAAIRRALLIGANHAGNGGALTLATCCEAGALLEVTATSGERTASDEEPTVDFRCCSVKEFIREHGGRLDVKTHSDGNLRLILHMDAD